MKILKIKFTCFILAALPLFCFAQLNSPYSRYGVGNLVSQASIGNRGMGGISAAYTDPTSINTINPASYSDLIYSTLDIGLEYDGLNLKSKTPQGFFKSNDGIIPYLEFGFPLLRGNKKAENHKISLGMAFGLKPITRINYKIGSSTFSTDSSLTSYEGSGGVNEAFVGTGIRIKNFSIGFNTGYLFGEKSYNTRLLFNNDSLNYYKTHYGSRTRFGGMFLDAGMQYLVKINKSALIFGAYGTLQRKYGGSKDNLVETFNYNVQTLAPQPIDTVSYISGQKGKVQMPATFGGGIAYSNEHLLVGADYETTKWSNYSFFGQKDFVKNSWNAKIGIQYLPASSGNSGYFNFVKYRAGFNFGQDYIDVENSLPFYTVSVGGSFPLKLKRSFYDNQYSVMNFTFEYGNRGNNNNNITENIYKVSLGFSLSDIWFLRQKYR
ncbi:MAG: hypothetical protein KGM16_10570 [Bacteroidota bacterium]|nr:hypothetical protein [Bacteroidota bacterium]